MEEFMKWFKQAEKDYDTAKYNFDGRKLDAGLFFLQQTVEKALKAIYIKKFKKLIKTHDLVLLSKHINAPDNILDKCKKLTLVYLYTRYPDVSTEEASEKEINGFIKDTEEILKWTKKHL